MTIAEVSKKYDLTPDTLRYLEEQREKLVEKQKNITETLERLDYKIKLYGEIKDGKRKDFSEE